MKYEVYNLLTQTAHSADLIRSIELITSHFPGQTAVGRRVVFNLRNYSRS